MKTFLGLLLCFLYSNVTLANPGDWKKITGTYSWVEYLEGQEKTADSLLKIAELSLPRISKMVGVPLSDYQREKCRIVLTDAPDVTNGFAIDNTVVIYATSSMYVPFWTGTIGWYHQVLTHELVHHVTFRAVRRQLSPFTGIISIADVPRWFWEGTAQYYSEYWNAYRGDLYLKNAVFDGSFNFNSLNSLDDGRLLYASGHAFIRFLADQYGDSSLVKLMAFEKNEYFYDFDKAFKSVYKKSPSDIFPAFHRHLVLFYGSKFADYPVTKIPFELPDFGFSQAQIIPISGIDSTWLTVSQVAKNHQYATLAKIRQTKNKLLAEEVFSTDISTEVIISDDREWMAWGRSFTGTKNDQDVTTTTWTVKNLDNELERVLVKNVRARFGTLNNEGLVLAEIESDRSVLNWYPFAGGAKEKLFETPMPIGRLATDKRGNLLFEAQRSNGNRDLFLLDNQGTLSDLTNDQEDDRSPIAVNDSLILFNRIIDNQPALAVLNKTTGEFHLLLRDLYEYWLSGYDSEKNRVILKSWKPGRKTTYSSIQLDSLLALTAQDITITTNERVTSWTTRSPEFSDVKNLPDTTLSILPENVPSPHMELINAATLAFPYYANNSGGLFASTTWLEALQRQAVQVTTFLPVNNLKTDYILAIIHQLRVSDVTVISTLYHGPALFSFKGDDYLNAEQWLINTQLSRTFYYSGNPRLALTPLAGFLFSKRSYSQTEPFLPDEESFYGPTATLAFNYRVPSTFNSVIEKRRVSVDASLFRSIDEVYDFSVFNLNMTLGTNIYSEKLGILNKFSAIRKSGLKAPRFPVGIDRFYELDIPRDYGFTRTIRGLREDINGNQVLWNQTELTFLITENTPLVLLVLPVRNVAITGFADGAFIRTDKQNQNVHSYGGELSFGEDFFRLGTGYAKTKGLLISEDEVWFLRFKLVVPEL
ncbi:MAG: hypothetical protein LCH54_04780 [Bacteroidetes bacterium]|nr:hypothetical protein [Bacteroidota bacterium]